MSLSINESTWKNKQKYADGVERLEHKYADGAESLELHMGNSR